MPDLDFLVESASVVPFAATPTLAFHIAVTNAPARESIFSVALRCQIQIEVTRRRYTPQDQARLLDLFGEPERWGQTLHNMLWINVTATIPPFSGTSSVEVQVPCTFDFNIAATKYFHGVGQGEVPLNFLFSGTVFYDGGDGTVQVAPIAWTKEARFRLPVETWRGMMDIFHPNTAWISLRRDTFERLYRYRMRHGLPTWEAALEKMLAGREELVKT